MDSKYGFVTDIRTLKISLASAGNSVLEVGCGGGAYCTKLQRPNRIVLGIDISRKLIKIAKAKGVEVCLADAQHLPFKEKSFETVLCFQTLEHVVDDFKVIKEIARVANKHVLISVPNASEPWFFKHFGITYRHYRDRSHLRTYTVKTLMSLMESAGIRVIKVNTFSFAFSFKGVLIAAIVYLLGIRPAIMVKGVVIENNVKM